MTFALAAVLLLTLGGLTLVVINGRKLVSDWPRPKPRHNVDLAWIQVYAGLALLVIAWAVATDPARKLIEPTPKVVTPEAMERADSSR